MQTYGLRAINAFDVNGDIMAIYHLSIKTISRSDGRTATAAAAYRAGDIVECEYTGIKHDYSRKKGVISSGIIAPKNSPEWVNNRSKLWSNAELSEKRKNSTVAREFEFAIPAELNEKEREELVIKLAKEIAARHECVVDYAIHAPSPYAIEEDEKKNFHVHILLTTRRINEHGFHEKTRELDDKKTGEVDFWRKRFADVTNEALNAAGSTASVDHRSHAERGIERPPTIHAGPAATALKRRGEATSRRSKSLEQKRRKLENEASDLDRQIAAQKRIAEQEREQETIDLMRAGMAARLNKAAMDLSIEREILEPSRLVFKQSSSAHVLGISNTQFFVRWIAKDGTPVYLLPNDQRDIEGRRAAFTERRNKINVYMPRNLDAVREALLVAAKKWPDGVVVNGDPEFKAQAILMANDLGIKIAVERPAARPGPRI